jgi:hypothetical protein
MILKKASYKAIKYSCLKFHYAKSIPVAPFGYSVFNKKNEWCGCIVYGLGATNNLGKSFNLSQGKCLELTRMALNGKQESTSKALAISIKLIAKHKPLVKLLVSYADTEQKHIGIIYQATNWIFTEISNDTNLIINEKRMHRRSVGAKYGTSSVLKLKKKGIKAKVVYTKDKYKYLYPLTKDMRIMCNKIKKEYIKNASIA